MKTIYFIVLITFMLTILIRQDVDCSSNLENLSYGQDVLTGKVSATEKPIETTTKESFFKGIKKLFGGGKTATTTTTTEAPSLNKISVTSSTTPKPSTTSTTPSSQKPHQNRDFVAPTPNSPFVSNLNGIILSTTSTTTIKPDNRRDFVAPIRPGSPTISGGTSFGTVSTTTTTTVKPDNKRDYIAPPRSPTPSFPHSISTSSSTTTTVKPNNGRDYVAPTRSSSLPPVPPRPSTPYSGNFPGSSTPSSNRRDYVNPNLPSVPNRPSSTSTQVPPSIPPRSGSPNILDNKDFPPLGPVRGGSPKPTPSNARPGGQGSHGVSFVTHKPTNPPKTGSKKNQLAQDDEITTLTESLISKDVNNQNQHITINLQGKTKSTDRTDEAPDKLLEVKDEALQTPTIAKMRLLFNNYEIDTSVNEYVTPIEHKEENDFIDAVMATSVMRTAMQFLQSKGIVTPDPKTHRDYVKTLWFTLYSRGGGRIGSSAFEHVFLNEIKNGTVIGMHNWVYYAEEEKLGHADYQGYIRTVDLGNKGAILKYRFNYNGLEKYANTLFVGTSPELEMALYTVCFAVRADQDCPISLNHKEFNIVTHTWKYRGKQLIGSAYPEI